MKVWAQEDFDKLVSFDASQYAEWLQKGLMNWDNPAKTYLAFAPVQDRFNVQDPIECQLAEMAEEMPRDQKQKFFEGLKHSVCAVSPHSDTALYESLKELQRQANWPAGFE